MAWYLVKHMENLTQF